jgi:Flp pilus assembly pilin Flp
MLKLASRFAKDDDGAVTVDWVLLTAGVVAFNIAVVVALIEDGITQNANYVNDKIDEASADMRNN